MGTYLLFLEPGTQCLKLLDLLLRVTRPNLIVPLVFGVEVVVFLTVVQLRQVSSRFSLRLSLKHSKGPTQTSNSREISKSRCSALFVVRTIVFRGLDMGHQRTRMSV